MRITPGLRKGAWTAEEDILLRKCIEKYGEGKWHQVPVRAGLNRCRKSCRLRWLNYLRPDIKRGGFSLDEVDLIIRLHKLLGNRWSLIAGRLPGRTANDVKNYWNTHLLKKIAARRSGIGEGKAGKTTTNPTPSNIVKPRPRAFSKNASWSKGKTTSTETVTATRDETFKDSSPSSQPTDIDINMQWWDNLFQIENEGEGTTWSMCGGSGEDHIASLWSEELSQLGVEDGCKFTREGDTDTGYFSIDTDLWDLLMADQQAMQ